MNICIFGSSSVNLDDKYYKTAYDFGKYLSSLGHGIVFGGGNEGVMGEVARGVKKNNGYILGIAPKFFDKPGILFPDCDKFIFTNTMRERKQYMEDNSDAFIALPGGMGTYEELIEVLTLKQLGKLSKPIGIYNVYGYFDTFLKLVDEMVDKGFMKKEALKIIKAFDEPKNLIEQIEYELKNPMDIKGLKNI